MLGVAHGPAAGINGVWVGIRIAAYRADVE
jgi:hypothetical protein